MEDYKVAIYFLLGSIIIGAALYAVVRVVFSKKIQETNSATVTKWGYIQAIFIVSGLLVLFWFMHIGNQMAATIFAVIMLASNIYGHYYLNKQNRSK